MHSNGHTYNSRMHRKLIVYIAASLDGIIAGPGDDLSFLESVQTEGEDYGYGAFMSTIDTVILGRKTYDWVMDHAGKFPHGHLQSYVLTRTSRPAEGSCSFYSGDLAQLVGQLKSEKDRKNIFCDGGAQVINELLRLKAVDEIILSVIPVLLGTGTRLFNDSFAVQNLELISAHSFATGLVQQHYKVLH